MKERNKIKNDSSLLNNFYTSISIVKYILYYLFIVLKGLDFFM